MSLLLLFGGEVSTGTGGFACWMTAAPPVTAWSVVDYDYKNTWGEWSAYTWGQLNTMGITWENMSGFTFSTVTGPTTTWTQINIDSCGSV